MEKEKVFSEGTIVRVRCEPHGLFGQFGVVLKAPRAGDYFSLHLIKFKVKRKPLWCYASHLEQATVLDMLARV